MVYLYLIILDYVIIIKIILKKATGAPTPVTKGENNDTHYPDQFLMELYYHRRHNNRLQVYAVCNACNFDFNKSFKKNKEIL